MSYPQKPPLRAAEMESFFSRQTIGVVCSHNSDETIHAVPVQLAYRDGAFFFGTQGESRKARNLMRNQDVTLLLDERSEPYRSVTVYGHAEIERHNVEDTRVWVLSTTTPVHVARDFVRRMDKEFDSLVVRVWPKKVVSVDYSKTGFIEQPRERQWVASGRSVGERHGTKERTL